MTEPYIPAQRVEPDPEGGWSAADLTEDEYVDDDVIRATVSRVYPPLLPENEKLFSTRNEVPDA